MIIACLAVRLKSKRLPRKALIKIKEKPIFQHVVERVKKSKNIDKIIVCTSTNTQDDELYEVCLSENIECFRGDENDVMKRFIDAVKKYNPKHIVRMTGDNPCISYEFIDIAVKSHIENDSMYTTTEDLPRGMRSEVINFNFLQDLHQKLVMPEMTEYMTWYLDRPDMWKVTKVQLESDYCRNHYRFTCDTESDLKLINEIYENLYTNQPPSSINIIKFIDDNNHLTQHNSEIKQKSYSDLKSKIEIRTKEEVLNDRKKG